MNKREDKKRTLLTNLIHFFSEVIDFIVPLIELRKNKRKYPTKHLPFGIFIDFTGIFNPSVTALVLTVPTWAFFFGILTIVPDAILNNIDIFGFSVSALMFRILLSLTISSILSFITIFGVFFSFNHRKPSYNDKTLCVAYLLLQKKRRDALYIISALFITLAFIIAHGENGYFSLIIWSIVLTLSLIIMNFGLLYLRIKLGYYGNTASEVREILLFIKNNSDNGTFGGGGNAKIKIFPNTEEITSFVPNGIPANAGGGR